MKEQNEAILAIIKQHPEGLSRSEISKQLPFQIHDKTLQRRLIALNEAKHITKKGNKKTTLYFPFDDAARTIDTEIQRNVDRIFSFECQNQLKFLDIPFHIREKVSYKREFLDTYIPNHSFYIPKKMQETLFSQGKRFEQTIAAGTYARRLSQRLLIDLSYNSSRLEGNTYSRLDTQKLIAEGISPAGKIDDEKIMILNHKEAILFLIENAEEIQINTLTIRNLHSLLSQDLLGNSQSCGSIRNIEVDIGQSAYQPLNNPHLLKELFELILQKAKKISDPFEQSFFLLIHLSYLQAFEDVNKRTARLSCNIPFIKNNLCPLSFTNVARNDYIAALLAIYENNAIEPMRELFAWAYACSCNQYGIIKESLGEIDPFRIQYRKQRKTVMGKIIRQGVYEEAAEQLIARYCQEEGINDVDKFTAMTLADLSIVHAGAMIGLGVTEAQLEKWIKNRP